LFGRGWETSAEADLARGSWPPLEWLAVFMHVLVTGANGLLGSALVSQLAPHHDVLGLDLPELDITDRASVERAFECAAPDVVIHCAAYTDVDRAESEPDLALLVNGQGAGLVAQCCEARGSHLIHISTDYVFSGEAGHAPFLPTDRPAPINAYGHSKLAGEVAVREHCPAATIVRTCGLYGLRGRSFVAAILSRALAGEPLKVVDDQTVGAPTYAVDLAQALATLASLRPGGIVHLVNAGVCTWYEFAVEVLRAGGLAEHPIEPVPTDQFARPARRPAFSALASGAAHSAGLALRPYAEALHDFIPTWLAEWTRRAR